MFCTVFGFTLLPNKFLNQDKIFILQNLANNLIALNYKFHFSASRHQANIQGLHGVALEQQRVAGASPFFPAEPRPSSLDGRGREKPSSTVPVAPLSFR